MLCWKDLPNCFYIWVIVICGFFLFQTNRIKAKDSANVGNYYKPGDNLSIELVTVSPGDNVTNYFGHNFMVVSYLSRGVSRVYNYGTFLFNKEMLPKFIKGRLEFWVSSSTVNHTYRRYIHMNRSIRVQELNLSAKKRWYIASRLAHDLLPQNSHYLYHHFLDNCSTRLRDIIDDALEGQFKSAFNRRANFTYRQHVFRYTQHNALAYMVIDFIMNRQVDQPIRQYQEAFLPDELRKQVESMVYLRNNGQPTKLVKRSYTVFTAKRQSVPEIPSKTWPYSLMFGLIGSVVVIGTAVLSSVFKSRFKLFQALFGLEHIFIGSLLGLPGLLLFFMANFTNHLVTYQNENLFLTNPLTFLALPVGLFISLGYLWAFRVMKVAFYLLTVTSTFILVAKLYPGYDQNNLIHILLITPINFGFALAHFNFSRQIAYRSGIRVRS